MDTILIIEDDADLREGLEYTLSGEGYQILISSNCCNKSFESMVNAPFFLMGLETLY